MQIIKLQILICKTISVKFLNVTEGEKFVNQIYSVPLWHTVTDTKLVLWLNICALEVHV